MVLVEPETAALPAHILAITPMLPEKRKGRLGGLRSEETMTLGIGLPPLLPVADGLLEDEIHQASLQ